MTIATSVPTITTMLNHATIRDLERASIRSFVESCSEHFIGGRVLDYGCGKQPYRDVVERMGGSYEPYDRVSFPANVSGENVGGDVSLGDWRDAVICTQVIQYWPDPAYELQRIKHVLHPGGHLVLTYPTCWDEVEPQDLHRFTRHGIDFMLDHAGFTVIRNQRRAEIDVGGFRFPLGGGALARA